VTGGVAGFDDLDLAALRRRRSYKWRRHAADVVPAFVAEMDFPLAPEVASAIREMAQLSDTGYTYDSAELATALSGFARNRWGWSIDPGGVVLVPDVMSGALAMLRILLRPGDGVVVNTPVYPPFFEHIAEAGCRVVRSPLSRDRDGCHRIDLDALDTAFARGARAYLLCNPHNPTGSVPDRQQLEAVAAIAAAHDAVVISDEIHAPLTLPGATHTPYLSLGDAAAERGVALLSASKAWNLPGLKCAQLVASGRMLEHAQRMPEAVLFRIGIAGVWASAAAYAREESWLDSLLQVIDRNRSLMADLLHALLPRAGYVQPQATYLAWVDCGALELGDDPASVFLERGRVALADGRDFGEEGRGYVRVTMGTSAAVLQEVVERMAAALR
jgi:cystathionine beta-lyase